MSRLQRCHHYYLANQICRICGHDKTPGNLMDLYDMVHQAAWQGGVIATCERDVSRPALCRETRRKVVTCLRCAAAHA